MSSYFASPVIRSPYFTAIHKLSLILLIYILQIFIQKTYFPYSPDENYCKLVKLCFSVIFPVYLDIYNCFLQSSSFSSEKSQNTLTERRSLPKRLISTIPSKPLERLVHSQLTTFFEQKSFLIPFNLVSDPSAFHIIRFVENYSRHPIFHRYTENNFDFSKVLDSVNHSILLSKLQNLSISVYKRLLLFLSLRSQTVILDKPTLIY